MEIRCHCTACGAAFRVRDEFAGKRIKCVKCGAAVGVPQLVPAGSAAPASQPPPVKMPPPVKPPALAQEEGLADLIGLSSKAVPVPPAASARSGRAVRKKSHGWQTWHTLVAAGVGVAAAVGLVVMLAWPTAEDSATHGKPAAAPPPVAAVQFGVLVLELPEAERSGASVLIDDEKKEVAAKGPLEYRLAAGEHRVKVVSGCRRVEHRLTLKAGEKYSYQPAWPEDNALAATVPGDIPAPNWAPGADAGKGVAPRGPPEDFRSFPGDGRGNRPGSCRAGQRRAGRGQAEKRPAVGTARAAGRVGEAAGATQRRPIVAAFAGRCDVGRPAGQLPRPPRQDHHPAPLRLLVSGDQPIIG